jgi:predicted O-methyltransferase YrrM
MQPYILAAVLILGGGSIALNLYLIRKMQWIFKLNERIKRTVDKKFHQLFRQFQILQALQHDLGFSESLPPAGGKAASPDFLKVLADHVLAAKPEIVVECGSGLSTVIIARCLQLNGSGHVYSMEHMEQFAGLTREELARQGLSDWASVVDAPLTDSDIPGHKARWYQADKLPDAPIDLLVVDGPPARTGARPRYPAGPKLFPRLSSRGAIFVDDAGRPEELAVIADWCAMFPQLKFDTNVDDFEKGACLAKVGAAATR